MTSSTLEITPRSSIRGAVSNAEAAHLSGARSVGDTAAGLAFHRATHADFDRWLEHVRAAAGCTRPVRLTGDLYTVARTGPASARVLDHRHTDQLPDGAIYKACGTRVAAVCPACARIYQGDAYQIVRSMLIGGNGVPDTVAAHPAVFATLTAPSFGEVHARNIKRHTCVSRSRCDCRPDPCHARRDHPACRHSTPMVCWTRHNPDDLRLGQPLCLDCYDHTHQVVWNLYSASLWHRTKQIAERWLAQLCRYRRIPFPVVVDPAGGLRRIPPVRLGHGKVAEMQRRAVVHFHALIRLDGVDPHDLDAVVLPPAGIGVDDLVAALEHAAATVGFHTPPHPDQPEGWPMAWGDEGTGRYVDARPITLAADGSITDQQVAGYLAKYSTKSTEITGHSSTRLGTDRINDYADPDGDHTARLIDACWRLGRPTHTPAPLADRPKRQPGPPEPRPPLTGYRRLRRWAHRLGYGGHFLTKARRGAPPFALLRNRRITYRRAETAGQPQQPVRTVDHLDEDTTLTVGVLTYAGTGWHTTGDALLANTAAALARARHAAGREELAHESGTTLRVGAPTAA